MDWATRRVLSWRLSNTLDARFCTEALSEALERYGRPEIFNTDQGSQFTSLEFTSVLKDGRRRHLHGRPRPPKGPSPTGSTSMTPKDLILPSPAPPRRRPTNDDS